MSKGERARADPLHGKSKRAADATPGRGDDWILEITVAGERHVSPGEILDAAAHVL